jgi:hypothetical protein
LLRRLTSIKLCCGGNEIGSFYADLQLESEKRIVGVATNAKPIRQVAAVPFRLDSHGNVEVMLITSTTTNRFIVPKGWPMKA